MVKPVPRYTLWQAVDTAIALGVRALEEIRTLARQPGPRGPDGLGFDDMSEELADDGRTIIRRYSRGDQTKEFRHTFAVTIYRGVFKEGTQYDKGDTVTWGGSVWHCNGVTGDKPGEGSKSWTLMAKRGSDGKNGERGLKGEKGDRGENGRDLTVPVGGR